MITQLRYGTLVVSDQDEALSWYTVKLGFEKRMDRAVGSSRWLSVGIQRQPYPQIILQKPSLEEPQEAGWATAALIEDLYGNTFTLAQPK